MFKFTPNPPETNPIPGDESPKAKKFNEAVDHALSHFIDLGPEIMATMHQPNTMFIANPKTRLKNCW